jgi:hypothetical protein
MAPLTAESRAGIVGALRDRPQVRNAYDAGKIGLEHAWLIVRTLGRSSSVPQETEIAWIEQAQAVTVKRLRDVMGWARRQGIGSFDPATLDEQLATIPTSAYLSNGAARRKFQDLRTPPLPPTDDEWQKSLLRQPGMTLETVTRYGYLALLEPAAEVSLRLRLKKEDAGAFLASIESERRRLDALVRTAPDGEPVPGESDSPAIRIAREYRDRERRLPGWVGLQALIEDYVRTYDDPRSFPEREEEKPYERDGYRCMAPGCTRRAGIHGHHLRYRSRRGSDELWNQLSLCDYHHLEGEHGEFMQVRGKAPLETVFRLGKPGPYASLYKTERRLDRPAAWEKGTLDFDIDAASEVCEAEAVYAVSVA